MSVVIIIIVVLWLLQLATKSKQEPVTEDIISTDIVPESTKEILEVSIKDPFDIDTKWHTDIFFDEGDPKDWDTYIGQALVKEFIQLQIDVLKPNEGLKQLLVAQRGQGKTTLFRIIGKKLIEKRGGRYIEVTPPMLKTKKQVDNLMGSLSPYDSVFVDEVHMFDRKVADLLLPAIEDGVYPFDTGMTRIAAPISWVGASTDIGMLPIAFQDRFQVIALDRLSDNQLASILHNMKFPIEPECALEIAKRATGSPRELKRIFKLARDLAVNRGDTKICNYHIHEAFRILDLDENGLYPQDRKVLNALRNNPKKYASGRIVHAHSERAIRAITGIDEALYRDQIEPKLLSRGFLTIATSGRELTEKSWNTYFGGQNDT